MYQSLVQCLVRVFPKTVPSVMCLSQQSDSTDNDIPSFICPFDIILTAMDLFRPEFDVANADKKDTINDEFRWPLGMAMYDDRYLCVADLDAKSLFIVDSMDETFPIVHTVRTVGAGWVAASRSGRVVISGKEECELKIYQIVSKEPWQFDIVRTISFKEDPNGIVFLLDDVQLAVCVQKNSTSSNRGYRYWRYVTKYYKSIVSESLRYLLAPHSHGPCNCFEFLGAKLCCCQCCYVRGGTKD
eukprot:PhF_6_TR33682/c0_g1_i7/m.49357